MRNKRDAPRPKLGFGLITEPHWKPPEPERAARTLPDRLNVVKDTASCGIRLDNFFAARVADFDRDLKRRPSFMAEAGAWFRAGREDLWNAIIPAFPDSLHPSREPGMPGTPTQIEVTSERGIIEYGMERE